MVLFQKISTLPPQKEFEIRGVVAGFQRAKMLVNAWSLTGISREVGGLRKNPFRGGGMDNIWNHTQLETKKV